MNVYRNLSIITVIVFLVGILITVIYLFNLPGQIVAAAPAASNKLENINQVIFRSYIIVGVELALGVLAVLFLFLANQHRGKANIVYVDKYSSHREREETTNENQEDVQDYKDEVEGKVKKVKEILESRQELKKDLDKALSYICNQIEASQGAIFLKAERDGKRTVRLFSGYAYSLAETAVLEYEFGEGLTGQAAKEGKIMKIDSVPDGYIKVFSGLGSSSPTKLFFIPIKNEEENLGVIEIASFKAFTAADEEFLRQLSPVISQYINLNEEITESN